MISTKEDLEFTMFIKSMEELLDGFSSPALEEAADKVTDALRVLALKARQNGELLSMSLRLFRFSVSTLHDQFVEHQEKEEARKGQGVVMGSPIFNIN